MAASTKPYPPPSKAHKNCKLCDEHYHSEKDQQDKGHHKSMHLSDIAAHIRLRNLLTDTERKLKHVKTVL